MLHGEKGAKNVIWKFVLPSRPRNFVFYSGRYGGYHHGIDIHAAVYLSPDRVDRDWKLLAVVTRLQETSARGKNCAASKTV
jgi:hypothetical protein